MNILMIATSYLPAIGGLEQALQNLSKELIRHGHKVVIVSERKPLTLPVRECIDGVMVYRFPFTTSGISWKGSLSYPIVSLWVSKQLNKLVKKHKIDVIHLQGVSRNADYGLRLSRWTGIPLVGAFHGVDVSSLSDQMIPKPLRSWQRRWVEAIIHEASWLTACSQSLARQITKAVPSASHKLSIIHNGVNIDEFLLTNESHGSNTILLIGRLNHKKGIDVALHALALLKRENLMPPPLLTLVGDGPERSNILRLIRELGIDDTVRWLGAITNRSQVAHLYATSRLVVVPSREEPFGIVCLEALASGRHIVASRTGGIPEIIREGIDGLLVEPEDPVALARAISQIWKEEVSLATPSDLRQQASMFSWYNVSQKYLELYQKAISSRRNVVL